MVDFLVEWNSDSASSSDQVTLWRYFLIHLDSANICLFAHISILVVCNQSLAIVARQKRSDFLQKRTTSASIDRLHAMHCTVRQSHIFQPPLRRCALLIKQGSPEKTGPIYDHHLHVQCNLKQCLPFLCHRSQALGCRTWRAIF